MRTNQPNTSIAPQPDDSNQNDTKSGMTLPEQSCCECGEVHTMERPCPNPEQSNMYAIDHAKPDMRLTVLGSRGLGVSIRPSAFDEAAGGITLWLELHDGPLAVTFSADETDELLEWIRRCRS